MITEEKYPNQCEECGSYRIDGKSPWFHEEYCSKYGDLQMDRWVTEIFLEGKWLS